MTKRRLVVHVSIFASMMALPLAQGCGGDDSFVNQTVTDAGDGDSTTAPGDSSTPTDANATTDSPTGTTFCAATSAYYTRCNLTSACDVARLANCANDEAVASPNATAAYAACETEEPCPDDTGDGGATYDTCLATHYGTPDSTLTTIVTTYCAKCDTGGNPATCDEGPIGRSLAVYDDAILGEIQSTCLSADAGGGDGGAQCADFADCARSVVTAHDPQPAACGDE
jgi:hypothetical protein